MSVYPEYAETYSFDDSITLREGIFGQVNHMELCLNVDIDLVLENNYQYNKLRLNILVKHVMP